MEKAYRVGGRVQGVGFRWWTRSQAVRLGLSGSVRNLADGTVAVTARGSEAALRELEALLGEGPAGARVDRVEQIRTTGEPDLELVEGDFHILH